MTTELTPTTVTEDSQEQAAAMEPCGFCGATDPFLQTEKFSHVVKCSEPSCWTAGPRAPTPALAIERWNRRTAVCIDADLLRALTDARNLAMHNTAAARIPECGDFGAIAQNLDWALGEINRRTAPAKEVAEPTDVQEEPLD